MDAVAVYKIIRFDDATAVSVILPPTEPDRVWFHVMV